MIVPLTPLDFRRRAARLYANKLGVVCGHKRFTYGQFADRTNRLANALLGLGIRPRDRVAYLSPNCHRLLEGYYGVLQAGAVLLPINIRFTAREVSYILNDAGAKVLCVDPELREVVESVRGQLGTVQHFVLLADAEDGNEPGWHNYELVLAEASAKEPPYCLKDENELAELFYTSGTTGANPKGVMLTHRTLYLHGLGVIITHNLNDRDVMLHTIPLFHVNGWGSPHALTCMGGTHVMLRRFDPATVCRLVEAEGVTKFFMVPTMANMLLSFDGLDRFNFRSLKRVVIGGAPAPWQLIRDVEQRLGCECIAGYGLTETSPYLTSAALKPHLEAEAGEARWRRQSKTGVEILGVDLRVVDEKGEDVIPDGQHVGEIVVRSNYVMHGYWNLPEETQAVLKNGWFHTGDLATIDEDQYVVIVDRKKDIIISGGENIASIEVERAVYSHPAVYECAVIGVPDEKWGEVPKAIVVLREGFSVSEQDIIEHCAQHLAKFKVPKKVEFVPSLPKSGTGKILKRVLREKEWAGRERMV